MADALSTKLTPELRVSCLTVQPELRQEFVRGETEIWCEKEQKMLNVMECVVRLLKERHLDFSFRRIGIL